MFASTCHTQIGLQNVGAECSFLSHCTAVTKVDDADIIAENYSIGVGRRFPGDAESSVISTSTLQASNYTRPCMHACVIIM